MLYLRLIGIAGMGLLAWFAYGWGWNIYTNHIGMAAKIERLERNNRLINSRVTSYQTLIARHKAAAAASKCKAQIEHWVKNPDEIPTKFDPFSQF